MPSFVGGVVPRSVKSEVVVPCDNSGLDLDIEIGDSKAITPNIFNLCGRPPNHPIVFLKSSTVPVLVKSPLCRRTSPSGTSNDVVCVSLIHTNLIHSSEGGGGRVSGL